MSDYNVKILRMRTRGAEGKLKAFFSVSLGPITIEDLRLIDGPNGIFIGFPSKKITKADSSTDWFEIVRLTRTEEGSLTEEAMAFRESVQSAAVEEFERRSGGSLVSQYAETTTGKAATEEDDLPF